MRNWLIGKAINSFIHRLVFCVTANLFVFFNFKQTTYAALSIEVYAFNFIDLSKVVLSYQGNTFQAIIASNGIETFAIFNYQEIQWLIGAVAGSKPAQVTKSTLTMFACIPGVNLLSLTKGK